MHDPFFVGGLERLGDLDGDRQRLFDLHGPAPQPVGERLAFDELHHEEVLSVDVLHAEQGRDSRVVERREHLGFTLESPDAFFVRSKSSRMTLIATARPSFVSRAR